MGAQTPEISQDELPQVINLSQVKVEQIQSELVRANQSSVNQLNAEEVELQMSAVGAIKSVDLHARDSAIGALNCEQASVEGSIVGLVRANALDFSGVTAMASAKSMSIKDSSSILTVAAEINGVNIRSNILLSRVVHGNVTTTLDRRTAILAGLVSGMAAGLVLLAGKFLFERKS